MNAAHNIYIHVPFCISKCNYCAFFSHPCSMPDWDAYRRGISAEIDHWGARLSRITVPTIFFGGGTPSLMPVECFADILNKINSVFYIPTNCEITLESNPGTLDAARLDRFISAGLSRLSVGVQSLNDEKLKFLGRRHNVADATTLLNAATKRGIRVSADFIYGMPGDTTADVIGLCHAINGMGLRHCSLYELTIEPNTPFGKMHLDMPGNSEMADMYNAIGDTLNLPRYEVSNYAAPGDECAHNQNIWDGAPYIGIGRGAAGRILDNGVWYEQTGNGDHFCPMTDQARAVEKIITGMRTIRGVQTTPDVMRSIDIEYADAHPDLIARCPDRIAVTSKGMLILDDILINLVR